MSNVRCMSRNEADDAVCINGIQLALIGLLIDRVSLIYMKVRLMGLACVNPLS